MIAASVVRSTPRSRNSRISRPNDGIARAAPEIATAMSRPLPVCPMSQPSGTAMTAATRTETNVNQRCCPSATGIGASPAPGLPEKIQAIASREEVHATATSNGSAPRRARRRCARDHGMSARPARIRRPSMTSAMITTATMPASTSGMMRRCEPFVKR